MLGHFLPDTVLGAVAQFLPDVAPAEGARSLWNVHISVRPIPGAQAGPGERMQSAEMLLFSAVHLASGDANHGPMIYWLVVAAICAFIAYGRFVLRPF